jgi:hypothetical protein
MEKPHQVQYRQGISSGLGRVVNLMHHKRADSAYQAQLRCNLQEGNILGQPVN